MVLTAAGGIIALAIAVVGILVFAVTYDTDDYWENQKIIQEVQDKNLSLDSQRAEIFKAYSVGEISLDEAIGEMIILHNDATQHVHEIEEDVKFLTVSHNFRNAKSIVTSIEKDLEFLENIRE